MATALVMVSQAFAEASGSGDPLAECLQRALDVLGERGGRAAGSPKVGFLTEGDSESEAFTLGGQGCVGVLAVGRGRARDLDVMLHTDSGIALDRDVSIDPFAYVRYCGAEGLDLVATVHMYKGRGEYRLVRIKDAPRLLPDLGGLVGRCFASETGVRRPSADVGPELPGPSLEAAATQVAKELRGLGYEPQGPAKSGTLGQSQSDRRVVSVPEGRCYAAAVVGGPQTSDLDAMVRGPGGSPVARDVSQTRHALMKFCTDRPGKHVVEIRMYEGAGPWRLQLYELAEPKEELKPPGLSGPSRVPFAETIARIRSRDMEPKPLTWGMLGPGQSLAVPVRLEAGRCYAFGGVASQDLRDGDLDMMLLDETGGLLAWDLGRSSDPMLFHCPSRSGVFRIVGRVYGARGRYLTILGTDRETTP
jgi:hypothetical protein